MDKGGYAHEGTAKEDRSIDIPISETWRNPTREREKESQKNAAARLRKEREERERKRARGTREREETKLRYQEEESPMRPYENSEDFIVDDDEVVEEESQYSNEEAARKARKRKRANPKLGIVSSSSLEDDTNSYEDEDLDDLEMLKRARPNPPPYISDYQNSLSSLKLGGRADAPRTPLPTAGMAKKSETRLDNAVASRAPSSGVPLNPIERARQEVLNKMRIDNELKEQRRAALISSTTPLINSQRSLYSFARQNTMQNVTPGASEQSTTLPLSLTLIHSQCTRCKRCPMTCWFR